MDKLAIIEALKELLRVALIALIPVLTEMLSNGKVEPKILLTVAFIAILRTLDKYLHEAGKNMGDDNLTKGLTRF